MRQRMMLWKAAAFVSAARASPLSTSPTFLRDFQTVLPWFPRAMRQSIKCSFAAVRDRSRCICGHNTDVMWRYASHTTSECGFSDWIIMRLRDSFNAFTPVLSSVHLRAILLGHMLMAGVHRALVPAEGMVSIRGGSLVNIFCNYSPPRRQ